MHHKKLHFHVNHKRRGMSSIVEVVACLVLFSMIVTALIAIMGFSTTIGSDAKLIVNQSNETDFLIKALQTDVKSSTEIEVNDEMLQIISSTDIITYLLENGNLYRNTDIIATNIGSGMFVPVDENAVGLVLHFASGDFINMTFSR